VFVQILNNSESFYINDQFLEKTRYLEAIKVINKINKYTEHELHNLQTVNSFLEQNKVQNEEFDNVSPALSDAELITAPLPTTEAVTTARSAIARRVTAQEALALANEIISTHKTGK